MAVRFQGKKTWLSLFIFWCTNHLFQNSNPKIIGQETYSAFSNLHVRFDMILGSNSHPLLKTALVVWPLWLQMSPASLNQPFGITVLGQSIYLTGNQISDDHLCSDLEHPPLRCGFSFGSLSSSIYVWAHNFIFLYLIYMEYFLESDILLSSSPALTLLIFKKTLYHSYYHYPYFTG